MAMNELPTYIPILFIGTVLASVYWLYRISYSRIFLLTAILWGFLQIAIAASKFYQETDILPPRIMLFGILPTLITIIILFNTKKSLRFIDQIDLKKLTLIHCIRVPVEIVLFCLFNAGVMSEYITFEGTNFDIFSGLTAPLVYFAIRDKITIPKRFLLSWNIICLLLLLNVVITAIFSIPSPFQKLAFDQPNIAVLYSPYVLLPTLVVPLVLLAHLIAIRRLLQMK